MENEIVIKNPKSVFNTAKRIFAGLFGVTLLYFFYLAFEQNPDEVLEEWIEFMPGLIIILVVLYYAFFRSKIHKKCFILFSNEKIKWRVPAIPVGVTNYRTQLLKDMLNPEYDEFEMEYAKMDEIKFENQKLVIKLSDTLSKELRAGGLSYNKIQKLKTLIAEIEGRISAKSVDSSTDKN